MRVLAQAAILLFAVIAGLLLLRHAVGGARLFTRSQQVLADTDLASLFLFASAKTVTLLSAGLVVGLAGLAWLAGASWPGLAAAIVGGLLAPRAIVTLLRRRRMARLVGQLPDALALWAGLLQSGLGLHPSLQQLAATQARPLGDELRVVVRQCRLGVPVDAAMEALCDRVKLPDLQLLASLLGVSRELGGNLAESLLRLSDLLRARLAMEGRIRALTSQGKLQGVIVGALPLLLLGVLAIMEPAAMAVLYREPAGWLALALIGVLELTGFVLIRRIVSIDV